jgi:hypothetical protein
MSMKKKSIEKLFQDALADFSQIPEEHVWNSISASLDKKNKNRRIVPLWWKLGGVAAVLAFAVILYLPSKAVPDTAPVITNVENETPSNASDVFPEIPNGVETTGIAIPGKQDAKTTENVAAQEKITPGKSKVLFSGPEKPVVLSTNTSEQGKASKERAEEIGYEGNAKSTKKANSIALLKTSMTPERNINGVSDQKALAAAGEKEGPVQYPDSDSGEEEREPNGGNKKSIFDAVAEAMEEQEVADASDKWTVGPKVAPVFFSSLSQGSPIHSSFQNNAKSGNINVSYGLAVSYDIGKKWQLRSGIHKVAMGYDTNDVSFSSSLNGATNAIIDNIDYTLSSKTLVVRSNTISGKIPTENALDVAGPDPSLNGKMIQELGYIEVPMEITYAVFDKKVGVNVIGGFSTLFLIDNSVMLESGGNATEMGAANNVNTVNLSTNVGLGFSYQLSTSFQLSLEPMFKYQLNTFSNTTGNFQPFTMGVYSGLNFKF